MKFYLHSTEITSFKEDVDKLDSVYDTINNIPVGTSFTPDDVVDAYYDTIREIGEANGRYSGYYPESDIISDVLFATVVEGTSTTVIKKTGEYQYE